MKNETNKSNGSPVTQREFDQHLRFVETQLIEIKQAISQVDAKVDKINSEKIPKLQIQDAKVSTKLAMFVSGIGWFAGVVGSLITLAAKWLIGL